jgi:uncharacterized damage-inducible protein DinB
MNAAIRTYVLKGASANPSVVAELLCGITDEDSVWDYRPDPERFTLREVLAHLADWEDIWLARATRILHEDDPLLEDVDEGKVAIDNNYSAAIPSATLARYAAGREKVIALYTGLPAEAWKRTGQRPPVIGTLTLDDLLSLMYGHDGYHTGQIVDWLQLAKHR